MLASSPAIRALRQFVVFGLRARGVQFVSILSSIYGLPEPSTANKTNSITRTSRAHYAHDVQKKNWVQATCYS